MTAATLPARPTPARPALGGFSLSFLGMEIRRVLRNRRTMIFILIMPAVFFLLFGLPQKGQTLDNGGSVVAYVMISLAVYGAMVATTSGGGMVAVERAQGWSRQLRLTPLTPTAYVLTSGLCPAPHRLNHLVRHRRRRSMGRRSLAGPHWARQRWAPCSHRCSNRQQAGARDRRWRSESRSGTVGWSVA